MEVAPSLRGAISNSRLIALDDRGVTFRVKDYRRNGRERIRSMTLDPGEFIRRFLLHLLPPNGWSGGFHRIRHYGLLASPGRKANIARVRDLLAETAPQPAPWKLVDTTAATPADHRPPCPRCGGPMVIIEIVEPRYTQRAQPRAPQTSAQTARTAPP